MDNAQFNIPEVAVVLVCVALLLAVLSTVGMRRNAKLKASYILSQVKNPYGNIAIINNLKTTDLSDALHFYCESLIQITDVGLRTVRARTVIVLCDEIGDVIERTLQNKTVDQLILVVFCSERTAKQILKTHAATTRQDKPLTITVVSKELP